jgi:hypothetical protein
LPDVQITSARLRSLFRTPYAFGWTFWLSRNRLSGSYLAFSAANRV